MGYTRYGKSTDKTTETEDKIPSDEHKSTTNQERRTRRKKQQKNSCDQNSIKMRISGCHKQIGSLLMCHDFCAANCALIILFYFVTLCLHTQFDPNHDWEIITSTYQVELFVFNFCFYDLPYNLLGQMKWYRQCDSSSPGGSQKPHPPMT